MGEFLANLLREAGESRTLYVFIALVATITVLRARKSEGIKNIRGMVILFLTHLVLLPVAALLKAQQVFEAVKDEKTGEVVKKLVSGGFYSEASFTARFLIALCAVQVGGTILFDVLGPLVRLRAPRILRDIVLMACSVIATFLVLSVYTDTSKLFTASALVTAVIGFSLQDTLGNIMGGISLQLDNSVAIGDWIKVGDLNGRVVDIRWRYTAIETRNWETIIVPNSILMKGQVLVLGRRHDKPLQWRRWVWFNVDFRFPPTQVIAVVEAAIKSAPIERVAADPLPNCVCMDFAESYGRYAVRYWLTDIATDDPTDGVIRQRIYFALKRAGMWLAIPAHANFITRDDSVTRRSQKQGKENARRLEALAKVDLFAQLGPAEREKIADGLQFAPFAKNETLTKQGAEAHWLYIIREGEVSVRVNVEGGLEREVARLKGGSFFGEMSLMTGAPRSATVVAVSDVECYKLDKAGFKSIIQGRPEIAEDVAEVLAKRRVELEAVKEGLGEEAKRKRMESTKSDLVDSIRVFFGLAEETTK